ncbi:MAG: hypothetical protein CO160_01670 [Candidatus Portnoybacteria bacterium CG_4_9_14_3_um_filter_43_11]|uniref:Uncharacterized protein n=1 Tax=Candidatus Portnoybacteria bacterium CG_4_9_14_3_um_filter_43_11 TaxID=1974805 RepID=A0A2M7YLK0_9BACT|nr:MAG: hypothetical protein CO160_01670 [Candidatus Portnoybacteria bacterium CG_4_9_14_3_um_filter_43_11]
MEVKPGDIIVIDGVRYVFGEGSAKATNLWLVALEKGVPEEHSKIHLFRVGMTEGGSFSPSEIKEALERANFNKTRHGL